MSLTPSPPKSVRQARQLIDHDYDQPLGLDQIARQANFSPYHFLRLFRQTFDEMPHQYLTRRRIERARELLIGTDLPVTEVCLSVGFQSLGSFSTLSTLRRAFSTTLSETRLPKHGAG